MKKTLTVLQYILGGICALTGLASLWLALMAFVFTRVLVVDSPFTLVESVSGLLFLGTGLTLIINANQQRRRPDLAALAALVVALVLGIIFHKTFYDLWFQAGGALIWLAIMLFFKYRQPRATPVN